MRLQRIVRESSVRGCAAHDSPSPLPKGRGPGRGVRSFVSVYRPNAWLYNSEALDESAGWSDKTASSPWPSPPEEERGCTRRWFMVRVRVCRTRMPYTNRWARALHPNPARGDLWIASEVFAASSFLFFGPADSKTRQSAILGTSQNQRGRKTKRNRFLPMPRAIHASPLAGLRILLWTPSR